MMHQPFQELLLSTESTTHFEVVTTIIQRPALVKHSSIKEHAQETIAAAVVDDSAAKKEKGEVAITQTSPTIASVPSDPSANNGNNNNNVACSDECYEYQNKEDMGYVDASQFVERAHLRRSAGTW